MSKPKILIVDIETSPIRSLVWGLFDQNIALNQIETDWNILSWAAKWAGEGRVHYRDQRGVKDITNDKNMLRPLWDLLNEADIVVSQNGKRFDTKKLNSRFVIHGFQPPAPYRQIDTLVLAKKHFGFTSNKLEYMTDKLCVKYKKLKHTKYPGFELWRECLAGNKSAWNEMKKYNIHDVLATEELYEKLAPWGTGVNFRVYTGQDACNCGSKNLQRRGYHITQAGKYQRYQCIDCGAWTRGGVNLFGKGAKNRGY